jgi:outer membrane protein TolC
MKFVRCLALAATFVTTAAAAEEARPAQTFTIDTAVAVMKREQPLVRAANSAVRAAEGNAVTQGHWTNPVFDASYMKAIRNSSYDELGAPVAGITQFLELSGAPSAKRRSAEAEIRATQADRAATLRDLEWDVREAFIHLAASYERERVRNTAISDLEHAATIVRARVGGGLAPRYDASRIEIALQQARADVVEAKAGSIRARADLDVSVGPGSRELVGVPQFDLFVPPPVPSVGPEAAAAERRPDIVASRERAVAASHDAEAARRSVFPGVGVRLGWGYGQGPGQVDLGVGVVVPLPVIERGQGTVVSADAKAEQNRQQADALVFAAGKRIRAAEAELALRVDAVTKYEEQQRALSDTMRSEAEAGYREAKLSVLELVDAYNSLRDTQLRLIDLSESAHVAKVDLGRASMDVAR